MKLRQKLAVVLASAMVVTAVPVLTIAESTAKVSKVITVNGNDGSALGAKAPTLEITLLDRVTKGQFYVTLQNSKFLGDVKDPIEILLDGEEQTAFVTAYKADDTTAVVEIHDPINVEGLGTNQTDTRKLSLSLANVEVSGEAKISIDGNQTEVSNAGPFVFANKSWNNASVAAVNPVNIYKTPRDGVKLGDIVITEDVEGRFDANRTVQLDLDHSDYEFSDDRELTVKISKGFGYDTYKNIPYTCIDENRYGQTVIQFDLPAVNSTGKGVGVFTITDLEVVSTDREPATGDLDVIVSGVNNAPVQTTTITPATVVEFGTEISVAEKKEVKSGKMDTVKITYKENTADSVADGDVDFVLDKGYIHKIAGKPVTTNTNAWADGNEDEILKAIKVGSGEKVQDIEFIFEEYNEGNHNYITGFTLTLDAEDRDKKDDPDSPYTDKNQVATEFFKDLELEISTKLSTEGEITLTSSGRYVDEASVVVMNATPNVILEGEKVTLKVGQTEQKGGKVVISEAEAGAFSKHSVIRLSVVDDYETKQGISLRNAGTITVDGKRLEISSSVQYGDSIFLEIEKESLDAASSITLEDLEYSVDRTVPQGTYDIQLEFVDYKGNGINYGEFDGPQSPYVDEYRETLMLEDAIVIGTPNEEELAANGLPKGTAEFVIGSSEYTVNGLTKVMDGAAYLEPGYTMVPVRYVAEALGVDVRDILFSNGKVTIFAGSRTIQLTLGSNVALVNGAPVDMATKVVSKNDRTYAPMGEIARILGVETDWDGASQTAKFINK